MLIQLFEFEPNLWQNANKAGETDLREETSVYEVGLFIKGKYTFSNSLLKFKSQP